MTRPLAYVAVLVASLLLLGGCPSEDDPTPADETPTGPTPTPGVTPDDEAALPTDPYAAARDAVAAVGADGLAQAVARGLAAAGALSGDVDADAVRLRARLATNLRSHAHLAAHTAEADLFHEADPPWRDAAAAALDSNVRELTEIVAEVASTSTGAAVHDAWSDLTRALLDPGADPTTPRERLADVLEDATGGELAGDDLTSLLEEHTGLLVGAVDSASDGDEAAYAAARDAAAAAGRTAGALARALAEAHEIDGDPDSAVATTQAELAGAFVDDVHLTLRTAVVIHERGVDTPRFVAVTDVLDAAAVRVAETLDRAREGSGAGLLTRWRTGIGLSVDLARAEAAGDDVLASAARSDLIAEAEETAGSLAAAVGGGVSADELGQMLEERVRAIDRAVRGLAAP